MVSRSIVPLFDRFGDVLAAEVDARVPRAGNVRDSLQHDLLRLFNVRNGLDIEQFLGQKPASLYYGLPDRLGLSAQSEMDLQRWQQVIAGAIAMYEPRLLQVRVQVTADPDKPTAVCVNISGVAALNRQLCQVHFDLVKDGETTRPRLHAPAPEPKP
jgi:type VI secretion system protein ImpF